jgi:hypothetical protein
MGEIACESKARPVMAPVGAQDDNMVNVHTRHVPNSYSAAQKVINRKENRRFARYLCSKPRLVLSQILKLGG